MIATITTWIKQHKLKTILTFIMLVLLYIFFWLFNHSRIYIHITGAPTNIEFSYVLRNNSTGDSVQINSSSDNVTAWVKRGSYEVSVNTATGNYISYIPSTPLFYNKQHVVGTLTQERARTFVGESVRPCSGITGTTLVSGGCNGSYGELLLHKPASSSSPAYTTANPDRSIYGRNVLLVTTGDKPGLIVRSTISFVEGTEVPQSAPSKYTLIKIIDGVPAENKIELVDLRGKNKYNFSQTHDGGFVAYQDNPRSALVYNSLGVKTKDISFDAPQTKDLITTNIDYINDSHYSLFYTSLPSGENKDIVSELLVTKDGSTKHFYFSGKLYSKAMMCGTGKICLLAKDYGLEVFNIYRNEAEFDFSAPKIASFVRGSDIDHVLAVSDHRVLNLDIDARAGYMEFLSQDYKISEIAPHKNSYVLHLENKNKRVVGLLIDQLAEDIDSIDKKITSLEKLPEINFVSIDRNYIYISAKLKTVYSEKDKGDVYSPDERNSIAQIIHNKIKELGISNIEYIITSNSF